MAGATIRIAILAQAARARAELQSVADSATSMGDRVKSSLGGLAGFAKSAGAGIAVAAAGAAGAGLAMGVKTAAGMEQAQIAFETMLGSADKAQSFIKNLSNFAAKTPFEFPGLQQSASKLIAAGVDAKNVIPIMKTLGDVTSGMGTGAEGIDRASVALQQMIAAQRISAEDLNQLRDAGIPVYDLLASALGKSKKEIADLVASGDLAKMGKGPVDALQQALVTGKGLERFNGLMEKQATSLTGLWSTLKDTLGVGLAQAIQPLIPLIKEGLGAAISLLGPAMQLLATGLSAVIGWLKQGASAFSGSSAAMAVLKSIADAILPPLQQLWNVIKGQLIPAMRDYVNAIMPVYVWLAQKLGPVVTVVFASIINVIKGALQIISGVIKVVTAVITGDWSKAWEGIKSILSGAWTIIKAVVSAAWAAVKAVFTTGVSGIVAVAQTIGARIKSGVGNLGSLLVSAGRQVIEGLIDGIKAMAGRAVSAVTGVVGDAVSGAKRLLGIASPSKVFREIGKQTGAGFIVGLDGQQAAARQAIQSLVGVGADIVAPSTSVNISGSASAAQQPIALQISSGGSSMDDLLVELLRRAVRVRGGNVQAVLGR